MSWKRAWWNVDYHKRANLAKLPEELHLANDPWFVLKRENVEHILNFVNKQNDVVKLICNGGLANESLFAIILHGYKQLDAAVISAVTHLADWSRMASATSPHLFKEANNADIKFIETELDKNKYALFIRKISPDFPDAILRHYIYKHSKEADMALVIRNPFFIYKLWKYVLLLLKFGLPLLLFYTLLKKYYNLSGK
jgi:hypothetical protein